MEKLDPRHSGIALIVFAKTPDVPVKTRIMRTESKEVADRIYRELLNATADAVAALRYHVAFSGNESPGVLTSIFNRAISFFPQTGNGLGNRMKNACLHCESKGYSRSIVIGCDCPDRTITDITQAAQALEDGHNVVLGPVEDGGYHLAGVDAKGYAIFDATGWSTGALMDETLSIVRRNKLKFLLLTKRFDVDTIEDYRRWKEGE